MTKKPIILKAMELYRRRYPAPDEPVVMLHQGDYLETWPETRHDAPGATTTPTDTPVPQIHPATRHRGDQRPV